jgi:3-mercaptopyruvate sulfurtransferase SseA
MLKAEIKRRNLTYEQVSAKLAEMGVSETPTQIYEPRSAGAALSAVFFVQCLRAVGVKEVRLD